MKAIIQIKTRLSHNNDFRVLSPNLLSLKVCGKKLFSYYFDLLSELGVNEIYVIGEEFRELIDEYYLSEVYPCNIKFIQNQKADDFYINNKDSFREDDLIIIRNIGFIFNAFKNIKQSILEQKENFILRDGSFQIEYIKNHLKPFFLLNELDLMSIKSIATLKDYADVNDSILNKIHEVDYTSGYSSSNGIIKGKNVQIDNSVKLIAPIVILDDIKVSKNCTIGPNVIVSNNVFIENNTTISNSIICDNTYVGTNLNFDNKIVVENKIIDKDSYSQYEVDSSLLGVNDKILI